MTLPRILILPLCALSLALIATDTKIGHADGLGVTPPDQISVPDGFRVELVYEVPADPTVDKKNANDADAAPARPQGQGSWVSLTVDPQGRLIACDQYGSLYRVDLSSGEAEVEKLEIEFAGAQGLLCAFGSLYANVNSRDFPSGVWRLTDTDGDDQYDKKEHIIPLNGGSEHGPHAMLLTPDGKRIVMCAGNNTSLPEEIATSRVPMVWDEDHLLGRMPDARGHNANRMAPGGYIVSFDPDGGNVELVATGFRNQYDMAWNKDGELFTYDADMEWDVGTPWYRPTRVNHVISGAEFGWRNGTGKWPAYYPDSFGAAVNIGPGSPTGISFGYGTNFPTEYRDALFIADWSYGNIHAVFLTPEGSTYGGTFETFSTGAPLPVTDMVVRPQDDSMYFTIGGRRAQSALYRIRYVGDANESSVATDQSDSSASELRKLRRRIESLHVAGSDESLDLAIENLGHTDGAIRFASRVALENHPAAQWQAAALALTSPPAAINAAIAVARVGEPSDRDAVMRTLGGIETAKLDVSTTIDLLRAYSLAIMRLSDEDVATVSDAERHQILAALDAKFPSGDNDLDRELAQLLVLVQASNIIPRVVEQIQSSPSQESQIHFAMTLRDQHLGWTDDARRDYFAWFQSMGAARGGMSFGGFLKNIKVAAVEHLSEAQQQQLADVLAPATRDEPEAELASRPFVQKWTVEDLASSVNDPGRPFDFERGKSMFAAAQCYKCHRIGVQ